MFLGDLLFVLLSVGTASAFDEEDGASSREASDAVDLEEMLESMRDETGPDDVNAGETGSFGARLAEYGIFTELHGYFSAEYGHVPMPWFSDDDAIPTFDLHHQIINSRARFRDRVFIESQLEWEHIGTEFYVSFAQIDVRVVDQFIVRGGHFVTPIGAFNEYQYPDFLRKSVQQPLFTREVVPSLWSEVGLQARGKQEFGDGQNVNYAVYVSNGLEAPEGEVGGSIRDMRRHARDEYFPDKAVGGRLGSQPAPGLNIGVSGYTGIYTTDGERRLSIFDADASLQTDKLTVRLEAAVALQEAARDTLVKNGGYAMVSYKVIPVFEPYLWYERVDLDDDMQNGVLCGFVIYPFPEDLPSLMWKSEVSNLVDRAGEVSGQGITQLTVGF